MAEFIFYYLGDMIITLLLLVYFVAFIPIATGLWLLFEKANEKGVLSFIPVVNVIILMKVAGLKWYWVFLLLFPLIGYFVLFAIIWRRLAVRVGYSTLFTWGLVILPIIFLPLLGINDSYIYTNDKDLNTAS